MLKIKKTFQALWLIARNPWLLNLVLDEELYWKKKVQRRFGFSSGLPLIDISNFLGAGQVQRVHPYAFLDGGSTLTDLALLRALAARSKAERYLEIGTWRGESVANVADVVPQCFTLNLSPQQLASMGRDEDYIASHGFFSKNLPNVTHLKGDSASFDFRQVHENFDLIFVDGDHHAEAVARDTRSLLEVLDPQKGILVWHDYAVNPEKIRWSVLYGILQGLPAEKHHRLFHVSNTLCAVYLPEAAGQFMSTFLKANAPAAGHFQVDMKWVKNEGKNSEKP